MPGSGYGAYELAVASIDLSVPEFVNRAEDAAKRRGDSDKDIDALIAALADERRDDLWVGVKATLDRQLQQEAERAVPAGARALQGQAYRLEKLDARKHRAGFLLSRALAAHQARRPALPFFDWLNALPEVEQVNLLAKDAPAGVHAANSVAELRALANAHLMTLLPSEVKMFVRGVAYLDEVARTRYCLHVSGGGFRDADDQPFDTSGMRTVFSGAGWGIYVQSPATGDFYSGSHIKGLFHHSSFLSGAPVLGAGEWQVRGGEVLTITGKSGHYEPEPKHFLAVLASLSAQGLNLGRTQARLFDAARQAVDTPVAGLLASHRLPDGLTIWPPAHA